MLTFIFDYEKFKLKICSSFASTEIFDALNSIPIAPPSFSENDANEVFGMQAYNRKGGRIRL